MSTTETLTAEEQAAWEAEQAAAAQGPDGDPEFDPDEEGEGEPEPDDEPEPDAAAQPVLSDKELEKGRKALDAETERHTKRVVQILGAEFASWAACPLCPIPGFVVPTQGPPEGSPDYIAALMQLGIGAPPELVQDPTTETCSACKGQGDVLTGALIERSRTKGCNACGGTGYTTKMPPPAPMPTFGPAPALDGGSMPPMIPGVPPPPTPTWDFATNTWKLPA